MRDAALILYERTALQFLQTMTIKFSPMADAINTSITDGGGTVSSDETTWKYYLNITGQYHSSDTMMTIQSLDTQQTIQFTRANLAVHTRTARTYVFGSSYYTELCARYPGQTDLIKSIVYPAGDINAAIEAPDFTILSYGQGFLEIQEVDVIIEAIVSFIAYAKARWYLDYLNDEEYFYWCFWGILWQSLFGVIMAARLDYIKTAYANSFHVWNYLESAGLANYRGVLSTKQALWLYRNIDYLLVNQGKQSNLTLLVNNLLSMSGVGLVGKYIYHSTVDSADTCMWIPEIVSQAIPSNDAQWLQEVLPQSITTITDTLYQNGLDPSNTSDHVTQQTGVMAKTSLNILPTKLVEIQPLGLNFEYGETLNNFVVDHLVYNLHQGIYAPLVVFADPVTEIKISLTGKQAIALYFYSALRAIGATPTDLPTIYWPNAIYPNNIPSLTLPTTLDWKGVSHNLKEFFDVQEFVGRFISQTVTILDPQEFSNFVGDLFAIGVTHIRYSRSESDFLSIKALHKLYQTITITEPFTLQLDGAYTDYPTWLSHVGLQDIISTYEKAVANTSVWYSALADLIMSTMMPLTNATLNNYVDQTATIYQTYTQIRNLFVQLCSYNIAFLDTPRDQQKWFFMNRILYSVEKTALTQVIQYPMDDIDVDPQPKVTQPVFVPFIGTDLYESTPIYDRSMDDPVPKIDKLVTIGVDKKILDVVEGPPIATASNITMSFGLPVGIDYKVLVHTNA